MKTKLKKVIKIAAAIFAVLIVIGIASSFTPNARLYNDVVGYICEDNYDSAKEAISQLPDDYNDVDSLSKFILILESFDELNRASYEGVIEQLDSFDEFSNSDVQKKFDEFYAMVSTLQEEYENDLNKAGEIENLISSIAGNNIENISPDDENLIDKARAEYNNASENVKILVNNVAYLEEAEAKIIIVKDNYNKAKEVSDKINEIGEVSLDSKDKISEAQSAYDSLNDEARTYVSNYGVLENAQDKYNELNEAEKKKKSESKKTSSSSNSNSGTVYWVPNGKVYHSTKDCPTLSRSKNIKSGSVPSGRTPCKVCH